MRIALLDDDPNQASLICQALTGAGYSCDTFSSGKDMLAALGKDGVDMILLNWQVSDGSGLQVLQRVREELLPNLPVMAVTARSGEDGIVAALDAGADDYIIKPVRRGELLTRVQVLLRRAYPDRQAEQIQFGPYVFESGAGRLSMAGRPIDVTQKEFELALLFFRNLDRPLSRAYILEAVWSRDAHVPSRTMDTHVSRVRNKLQLRPENGFRLAPVYSYGYRLELLEKNTGAVLT